MPNQLEHETSPYLLQHKENPVQWYPWGEAAFEKARTENKPILLSIGYSACHWCHVMAHESFEDEETAEMMNALFVNIKVDREERPDVDDIYMTAVQAMTGHGGWPMTVFLLPDGRPFYGGTYYPKEPRYGMPAFRQILVGIHDAFTNRRDEVNEAASTLTTALDRSVLGIGGSVSEIDRELLDTAKKHFTGTFDKLHGGFGGAPKFPNPMNFEFLMRYHHLTGDEEALNMVTFTLEKMARGGIYDQLGGGFARYSVDEIWLVPHFEKMLYDNAQLSRAYLHAWQITHDPFMKRVAGEIYDYILREMQSPEGGFYSATDADSEGEEGKFFVWTIDEINEVLGEENAKIAVEYWGMTSGGNFEGANILHVPYDDKAVAEKLDTSVEDLRYKIAAIKDTLYAHRTHRVHPGLDDKILTSWNGLMLASLAEAARVLKREDYFTAAVRAGEFIRDTLLVDDSRLLRTYNHGKAKLNAYLEDYANTIDAFLELYQTTYDEQWFVLARKLADHVLEHFPNEEGGFYDTSDDHEELIIRPRSLQDNAVPSGNGMMFKQLLRLSAYTGDSRYDETARKGLSLLVNAVAQFPQAFGESVNAMTIIVAGLKEVAIVGDLEAPKMDEILTTLNVPYRPNVISAHSPENVDGEHAIPLLNYRMMRGEKPTVYVCEHFTCKMPVVSPEEVEKLLAE